jgi:hypothetical protein
MDGTTIRPAAIGSPEPVAAPEGLGAVPGSDLGPGGFVPRGTARNFYAGAGGRLWYYLNNYYWVDRSSVREDLWLKTEVVEEFTDLRRWPDGSPAIGPAPKITIEYWKIGPTGRSVRLDNHKDYLLVAEGTSAGAIEVRVTLTLGRVHVRDEAGRWGDPQENYVLEYRDYADDPGIGAERTRFEALRHEPVNVYGYRIPWSTHPARLTRSDWQELEIPTWRLLVRTAPTGSGDAPVTTPSEAIEAPAPR